VRSLAISLWAVVLLAGCPKPPAGPDTALRAYLDAVAANRLDDAYRLMSSEYRKTHDRAAFERALSADARRGVDKLRGARVELLAEAQLDDGERLPLVVENGAWRIARDPLDFYPQRTPAEALRSFIRAIENKRWDATLKFVPARYRATINLEAVRARWEGERRVELLAELEAIRGALQRGEPFELGPPEGEARLSVGERKQARLVREDGEWKIETLE
jgi:hypothetical protein